MDCSVYVINWFLCLVGVFDRWSSFSFYVLVTLDIFILLDIAYFFTIVSSDLFAFLWSLALFLLGHYCVVIYYVLCC